MNSLHQQVAADSSAVQQPIQQQQQQASLAARSATPLPRPRAAKLWDIAVNDLGVLQGMPEPQEVSVRVQQLLQRAQQRDSGCRQHQSHQQQEGVAASSSSGSNGGSNSSSSSSGCGDITWSEQDVKLLLSARGVDMTAVVAAADALRSTVCGDVVSYVVNRNINYTNVCTYACKFCAFSKVCWSWLGRGGRTGKGYMPVQWLLQVVMPFCNAAGSNSHHGADARHKKLGLRRRCHNGICSSGRSAAFTKAMSCLMCPLPTPPLQGKSSEQLRGSPYLLPLAEITRRTAEAWDRGATEVCLQG
jgi:hypothetical protein